ncbi:MAG: YihY family inner membrane protein [Betaproteobacteria bacterium]|nr:YihY family inner membrane protein [Betaproteobacteria bacterium]
MSEKPAALIELARMVAARFVEERCLQVAASLTFTTLLALVPMVAVALTVISAFPVFGAFTEHLERFVLENLVPESAEAIAAYTEQFTENAGRLTALGAAFLGLTALLLMLTIDRAFNTIWRVTRPRPMLQRVLIYWTVLTVGPLLIGVSLSLTYWLVGISLGVVRDIPGAGVALLKIMPVVLTSVAFALLYLAVPNRRIALGDALLGGVAAGLAFEAMKRGFAFYVTQFPTYKLVYGAFASIPIFLLWVYLSWMVVVFGAVVVAVLPEWRARADQAQSAPGDEFFDALRILRVLWQAHRTGEAVAPSRLHAAAQRGIDRIEALLARLAAANWIAAVAGGGWVLARDAHEIRVADVYRLLVLRPDAGTWGYGHELDALARNLAARVEEAMAMTLGELFTRTAQPLAETVPTARVQAL